jgi:hypothetical protein
LQPTIPVSKPHVSTQSVSPHRLAQATKSPVRSYQGRSPDHQLNGGSKPPLTRESVDQASAQVNAAHNRAFCVPHRGTPGAEAQGAYSALCDGEVGDYDGMVASGSDAFVVQVADVLDGPVVGEPDGVETPTGAG